jgi:formylglycine-generating enzyme required for sulfatase activity
LPTPLAITPTEPSEEFYLTQWAAGTDTAIAQSWTPTSTLTPSLTPSKTLTLTPTLNAQQRAALLLTQTAINKTATATRWTKTPTPTYTLTPTPTVTPTATPLPAGFATKDPNGISMVYVPPGKFLMGSDKAKDKDASDDEPPQSTITIETGFWIDLTEVTNVEYQKFMAANGYTQDQWWTDAGKAWKKTHAKPNDYSGFTGDTQPRVGVTWYEAVAYCAWRGGRLPTEAEWEYAARGTDGRLYPWGNEAPDASRAVFRDNSGSKTLPVDDGKRLWGASWVGALDMAGNAWEWTVTAYADYREANFNTKVEDFTLVTGH